ncbi:hypothetical protein [Vibrio cyclitrophicus]|uniref:hypothetical protein n=1 Tax=Vibrio cyclitrophicus TaxID=47951 RepID=UPI000C830103|nr:hypothetical protein [Vibrio cyclitrophicus]PMJ73442.1 hypothetical protein BCU15_04620 [Vibrio cyclitrophicus]
MFWFVCVLVVLVAIAIYKNRQPKEILIWEGNCPPTTFSYRDQSERQRLTVQPIRLIQKGEYLNLIALDSAGKEKVFFTQLIDTMLITEGHKKMTFPDWVKNVLEKKL